MLDALSESGYKISLKEIKKIIESIEFDDSNKIHYSNFLAAAMSVKEFLTEDRLLAVFQQFDTKGTGKIKIEDVAQAMEKFGLSDRISD